MPNAIRMTADGYARLMAKARASRIHSSPIAPAVHAGPPETATARFVCGTGNRAPETDGRATGPDSGHSARLRRDVRVYGEGVGRYYRRHAPSPVPMGRDTAKKYRDLSGD